MTPNARAPLQGGESSLRDKASAPECNRQSGDFRHYRACTRDNLYPC